MAPAFRERQRTSRYWVQVICSLRLDAGIANDDLIASALGPVSYTHLTLPTSDLV